MRSLIEQLYALSIQWTAGSLCLPFSSSSSLPSSQASYSSQGCQASQHPPGRWRYSSSLSRLQFGHLSSGRLWGFARPLLRHFWVPCSWVPPTRSFVQQAVWCVAGMINQECESFGMCFILMSMFLFGVWMCKHHQAYVPKILKDLVDFFGTFFLELTLRQRFALGSVLHQLIFKVPAIFPGGCIKTPVLAGISAVLSFSNRNRETQKMCPLKQQVLEKGFCCVDTRSQHDRHNMIMDQNLPLYWTSQKPTK